MSVKCLICGKEFKNNASVSNHIKIHNMTAKEYKRKFNLLPTCKKCGKEISRRAKTGHCKDCVVRDNSGKNNPFYGKKHTKETIETIKRKNKKASKKLWQDPEYRQKVIDGVSKPRREGFAEEQSERITQWYKDNPEQRSIRSEHMKKSWAEGKIVSNNFSCNTSKIEEEFRKDVEEICGYKLPKKTIRLKDGKYFFPDVLIEELGLIIEFYGDYWHANPQKFNAEDIIHYGSSAQEIWKKDKQRVRRLESAMIDDKGNNIDYRVRVVWEQEYIDNKGTILKSLDFLINWDTCSF